MIILQATIPISYFILRLIPNFFPVSSMKFPLRLVSHRENKLMDFFGRHNGVFTCVCIFGMFSACSRLFLLAIFDMYCLCFLKLNACTGCLKMFPERPRRICFFFWRIYLENWRGELENSCLESTLRSPSREREGPPPPPVSPPRECRPAPPPSPDFCSCISFAVSTLYMATEII